MDSNIFSTGETEGVLDRYYDELPKTGTLSNGYL